MAFSDNISPFIKQCFVTAAVGINIIGFGCILGFPAILLPQLKTPDTPILLTKGSESWIVAVLALSVLAGNFISPPFMDRLGRKMSHYVLTAIFLIGWFIITMATSVEALIVGRILQGVAGGILSTLRSILIGEYTSPSNRGAFLTIVSLSQAFGIFLVHLIGSFLSWQQTAFVCVFFPFISLVMIIYTPESPSWLVSKGRFDECRQVFRWLRGNNEDDELEDMIEARVAFEQAAVKENKNRNWFAKLYTIIRKREFYKPIIIMIHSNVLLQFSGGPTLSSYSTVIMSLLMGPEANAYFWMVFIDTQRIIFNTIAIFIINKTKRRVMIFTTGLLSVGSHFAIAIYGYCRTHGWGYGAVWLPAMLINLQYLAVAVGTVPMPQVIGGEVFALQYRSIGGTISQAAGGVAMFLALKTFPTLVDEVGLHGTYTFYGAVLLANLVIVLILLPETKGKTLQQIENEFRGRPIKLEELEAKQSLQSNPIEIYERKMSERRCSNPVLLT
ncbi:facilitated trehalose transporter Tret1-2 homolog [Vanessa cardui]|uniref:facilitated trehalose transporter Tret1-2 homolog n=1 Tax=Vanessa cardui TaxID=171605 RepID=UPI001F12C31B|nr:facilitated trehalose transporter Tret1-2 homolog [Vanessa cardui]